MYLYKDIFKTTYLERSFGNICYIFKKNILFLQNYRTLFALLDQQVLLKLLNTLLTSSKRKNLHIRQGKKRN